MKVDRDGDYAWMTLSSAEEQGQRTQDRSGVASYANRTQALGEERRRSSVRGLTGMKMLGQRRPVIEVHEPG